MHRNYYFVHIPSSHHTLFVVECCSSLNSYCFLLLIGAIMSDVTLNTKHVSLLRLLLSHINIQSQAHVKSNSTQEENNTN